MKYAVSTTIGIPTDEYNCLIAKFAHICDDLIGLIIPEKEKYQNGCCKLQEYYWFSKAEHDCFI
jgi:hypothetical protein